jgi:hypothetical protein
VCKPSREKDLLQHLILRLRSVQVFFVSFFSSAEHSRSIKKKNKKIKATTIKIKETFLELNNFENSAIYQVYTLETA